LALIQIIKNLKGRIDLASKVVLGTRATLEGRADLEIGAKLEKMHKLRSTTIGMYYVQPILKNENSHVKSGQPSHQTIMKRNEGSLSNLKKVKVKSGVFMTLTLSHQVGWFIPHVWEEKRVCPFTTSKEWEKLFFISIFCCCFESLRRRGSRFGKDKRKKKRKTSKVNGKNRVLVHWKEEKAPLVLQKEIKMQLVREVKKMRRRYEVISGEERNQAGFLEKFS
jgi:hypothetical protein